MHYKNMEEIPTDPIELQEYLEECYDDLGRYTSKVSQEVIKSRISRAESLVNRQLAQLVRASL